MRKRIKRITAISLVVVMIILIIPFGITSVSATLSLQALRNKFPSGSYFNHPENGANNPDVVTYTPCPDNHNYVDTCTWFGGSSQCMGFAKKVTYDYYGSMFSDWTVLYDLNSLKAGDVIKYYPAGPQHFIWVTDVLGDNITYVDCNGDFHCGIYWDNTTTKGTIYSKGFACVYSAPWAINGNTGNNPQGVLDGVSGGQGTVTISGWAFDRDDLNASLEIHVYIGGRSGDSNAEGHGGIIANAGRGDVNAVHGCGDYHGFYATISTNKRGSQPIYVYALNVGGGDNVQIGEGTVNITSAGQPQITALYLSEKKKDSFRVCVQIDRPADVWEVRVATWTTDNQSDLKWTYASYNGYGTYFVDLSRSDFTNNQRYINHVYVYDYSGNSYSTAIDMYYTPPVISDVVISQVSTRGMRISCKIEGETNITSVSFPTWPTVDGNPIWHGADNIGNGYFTAYIYASEHDNPQSMAFHIYAYDAYGSVGSWGTGRTQLIDEPMEFASRTYKNTKYVFYNTALSWEDANKWCENNGGHLVTIKDQNEWNAVSDLLKQANGVRCWLGANSKNGNWKWVTGEELAYHQWASGEPNCSGGLEYYLGTTSTGNDVANCYLWNDYSADRQAGFICEFEDYYKIGDSNLDGSVNVNDVTAIQRHLVELETFNEEQLALADTNGDGNVDIADATHLQMYLAEYDIVLG